MNYVIGVDVGATNLKAGIVYNKRIIKKISIKTESKKGFKISLKNLINAIGLVFNNHVKSIGIGFPAAVDVKKGFIYSVNNMPGWKNVNLKKILEKKFKVPVYINNDANCFVLAEYIHNFKRYKNMVGVTLGTGIGVGAIINCELYSGNSCSAGEINLILINGKRLEEFTSARFIERKSKVSAEQCFILASKGSIFHKKIYKEFGKNLGFALAILVNTYDPQLIVIGGDISKAFKLFKKSMLGELKKNVYSQTFDKLKVVKSCLYDAGILGAAELTANK